MTDSRYPVISLKRQFDEVKRSIQSMRSSMNTPTFESLRTEETRSFDSQGRGASDRPSSAELGSRYESSLASKRPNTPSKSESSSTLAYVKSLEEENADLRRRLAAAETDKKLFSKEISNLKARVTTLEANAKRLENENTNLKATHHAIPHAASSPLLNAAETPRKSSISPSPITKSSSLLNSPEPKRPSSCIRSANSSPKKQRVVFNKDLKVAHYHSDDFRIFELPSHTLKGERPNFSQSSYSARAPVNSTPQRWAYESYSIRLNDSLDRRSPYSMVR